MSRRWRWSATTALSVAVTVALSGCSGSPTPDAGHTPPPTQPSATTSAPAPTTTRAPSSGLARFYRQSPAWKDCGGGFRCGRIRVPLDYSHPSAGTITLAVVRKHAEGGHRLGSLLLNPGGPGIPGISYARSAEFLIGDTVRSHYDIVGFDPRGVGESTPIHCMNGAQTDAYLAVDPSPDTPAEVRGITQASRQLGRRCAAHSARLLGHVDTRDAARDMDVLRAVLGDKKLNYFGKSYGTFLGATYADLFPRRVGRMVLDGVVDPALSEEQIERGQARGFQRELESFVADCLRNTGCPLSGSVAQGTKQVEDMLDRTDSHPLTGEPGRPVVQALALLGVAGALYFKGTWPVLRLALSDSLHGDGQRLLALADSYTERGPSGHFASNANDAIYAVNCLDRASEADPHRLAARARRFTSVSGPFGAWLAWSGMPCGTWPRPVLDHPHPIHAPGSAPILVVGTTRDPATPWPWARSLAQELDHGRLLTRVGVGHTAYGFGSSCTDDAVDAYLVHGTLPVPGTRCH
ncbi:MAG: hypothetical protein QOE01_1622 [Actinomycetota bacterium]|nr:hypothetical protein [Actinomycetota bacterium]